MSNINNAILADGAPLSSDLLPSSTEPMTAPPKILNSTVGTSAEKVLSKSTTPRGATRRCKLVNPTSGVSLGYATTTSTAPTLTSTLAGGGANDGSFVGPQSTEIFSVKDDADLYLAASAAASPYQLTVDEVLA